MNHVRKKHWMGCATASAATLAGRRYEDVAAHWDAINAFLDLASGNYPLSAAKMRAMRRDLDEHGFVAYF